MQAMLSETIQGVDKVKRYGWVIRDEPGQMKELHKDVLQIHPAYQRDQIPQKIKEITADWSWIAAGVIVVGERGGDYWVVDGQHRVLAAKRRSDIVFLPCIIFKTEGIRQEAKAFLDLNTGRKPVSSIGKFKAMIAAGDEAACTVHRVLESLDIKTMRKADGCKELGSVEWSVRKAREDSAKFEVVMRIAAEISTDVSIQQKLLDGLWYINDRLPDGINQTRFIKRLKDIGGRRLIDAANKAAAYFVHGGAKIWATGMMEEINKGRRIKFALRDDA